MLPATGHYPMIIHFKETIAVLGGNKMLASPCFGHVRQQICSTNRTLRSKSRRTQKPVLRFIVRVPIDHKIKETGMLPDKPFRVGSHILRVRQDIGLERGTVLPAQDKQPHHRQMTQSPHQPADAPLVVHPDEAAGRGFWVGSRTHTGSRPDPSAPGPPIQAPGKSLRFRPFRPPPGVGTPDSPDPGRAVGAEKDRFFL